MDNFTRTTYWYYLQDATLVHTESIVTTQRFYCLATYVNIVGTFLVIGSSDAQDVSQVNTFVRLGAGSTGTITAIAIQPTVVKIQ